MSNYVLITGAWHGGWAWRPVAQRLRAAGHHVLTPTLPGLADGDDPTGLTMDDAIGSVVALVENADLTDVILVGHSWGGYVITGAANKLRDRVTKIIYWSAFVPAQDVPLFDECPPPYQELFTAMAKASGNDTVTLPFEVWQNGFIQDGTEELQRLTYELLTPQPMAYFTQPVAPLDVSHLPKAAYLLSAEDVGLPPGDYGWARFAARLGVDPVEGPGSHEACFTRPAELAEAILALTPSAVD